MRVRLLLLALLGCAVLAAVASNRVWLGAPEDSEPADTASSAAAPEPPRAPSTEPQALARAQHPGRVADEAAILTMWAPRLTRLADAWHEDLGIDFQVATLGAPEMPVEQLAPEIFALREVGKGARHGGILLLLNPALGQARIEVSYELEPVFPDALLGRLAADQLAPYARYSAAGMAVMDVLHMLKDYAYVQAFEGTLALDSSYSQRPEYLQKQRYLSGGGGGQVRLAELPADADWKAPVPAPRRARYAPQADPLASAEAFLRAQRELVGDPTLALYTPGTRVMLSRYPFAPFEALERVEKADASKPLRVIAEGDRAVVTSDRPAPGFVPILLHRIDGLWRVDVAETFKNLFFGRGGSYRQVNSNHPYAFGLGAFGAAPMADVAAWDLDGNDLDAVIAKLESKEGAIFHFLLGEVLFRNCFAAVAALQHYERALELAPDAPLFRETFGDRALYLGFPELAAEVYKRLGHHAYDKIADAYERGGDLEQAERFFRLALSRNPYDRQALRRLRAVLERAGRQDSAAEVAAQVDAVDADPEQKWQPVEMTFSPSRPELHVDAPTLVGDTKVFDHSAFSVRVTNHSRRPVDLESVRLTTAGTGKASGLGDIVGYWHFPPGEPHLGPGQSRSFQKTWGFVTDTEHVQLSYVFDLCWRGAGDPKPQCRSQRVDLFPR